MEKSKKQAKIAQIMEVYDSLTDENKAAFFQFAQELHHGSLKKVLRRQDVNDNCFCELRDYILTEKAADCDEFLLLLDVFSYGYIYGKRIERARRSRREAPTGLISSNY